MRKILLFLGISVTIFSGGGVQQISQSARNFPSHDGGTNNVFPTIDDPHGHTPGHCRLKNCSRIGAAVSCAITTVCMFMLRTAHD